MKSLTFDFTPDPRVLIALTQTPIMPLDAICELIDNSIDSFSNSKIMGIKIEHPSIWIELPRKADLGNNFGVVRIMDNGPGMSTEQAESAIKAGYSGNNSIDTLGLFGMGFNISTGKLGIVTKFTTARQQDDFCTKTKIDLEEINKTKSYQIQAEQTEKPVSFDSGTIIEISRWWPEGHANHGFIYKLINYGLRKIREEIGRRYATILRDGKVQIFINGETCKPFEHCVWGQNRYVNNRTYGKIYAKYEINHVISTHRRCARCRSIIGEHETKCPSCGCTEIRSVEERITGWVGIQRFDHASNFGIDLIRNGRAIKIGEKRAFFEYVDEFQNVITDYPIDGPYGRIIGEIHLDFVPVDFLKQDFQRSSEEWINAMSYLRGNSSLQPRQPGADSNNSIIFKLFQGYRRVRTAGTTDMYMGYYDKAERGPKRISRDIEKEYYEKFLAKEPGYFDDAEWWKLVEEATIPPAEPMVTCPDCGGQNLAEAEICTVCGHIFKGKSCINPDCKEVIPLSAVVCQYCETSQVPKIETPWVCGVCGTRNDGGTTICKKCKKEKGAKNPLIETEILLHSVKDDELSIDNLTVPLCNGDDSTSFNLNTYYSDNQLISPITNERYPMLVFKSTGKIIVVIDKTHPLLASCDKTPIDITAYESAYYIYDMHRSLASNPGHTVSNIAWHIIRKYWFDKIEMSVERVAKKSENFLNSIKEVLATNVNAKQADRFFSELSEAQQKIFVNEMLNNGISLDKLPELKSSGAFLRYVPIDFILTIFEESPELFFNGKYWKTHYGTKVEGISQEIINESMLKTSLKYKNALETIIIFMANQVSSLAELKRVEASLDFLFENRDDEVI